MLSKIALIQGHQDSSRRHLCHALADAYGAGKAGHRVARVEIASVAFSLPRTQEEFNSGVPPASLKPTVAAILAAERLVLIFPLWLGAAPALVNAFLEQVMRLGVAFAHENDGARQLLTGRSVHSIVSMGMLPGSTGPSFAPPVFRRLRRNIFEFVGFSPVRTTMFGMIEKASDKARSRWLETMRRNGLKVR